MSDDSALLQFKTQTEEKIEEIEGDLRRAREETANLRFDINRTHRVVLELQSEMRSAVKQILARIDVLGGAAEKSGE